MNLVELSGKIQRCDIDRPYAFISYCSKDSALVWEDVCYLQKEGYNIWIDINLKETDESWKTGALEAIKDINCKLFIFYISKASVVSKPCLEELRCKDSRDARKQHGGKEIPWIVIEADEVGNMASFREAIFNEISTDAAMPREQKNAMAATLTDLMDEYFPDGDKVRVKGKNDTSKRYDYYQKIEENLDREGVKKYSCKELYERGIDMLGDSALYNDSVAILEGCASDQSYLPAILMLAFIYQTGVCGARNEKKAEELLLWASFQKDEGEWQAIADEYKEKHRYAEAVAFYSAVGVSGRSPRAFLEAAKMWMKMKNPSFDFTKKCAEEAEKLGDENGKRLLEGFRNMPESEFLRFTKTLR